MEAALKESASQTGQPLRVALLTGGGDKPYALGLASALIAQGVSFDFIGSDEVDSPELHKTNLVKFLNFRGEQTREASWLAKASRVMRYYARLIGYAWTAEPRVFHLLWHNKFELFDRIVLMLYYRLVGRRIVFTAHNVNAGKRDANDSVANRLSLRIQYRLSSHVFVHTEQMKRELSADFGVPEKKVSVIPFGINNTVPNTELTSRQAREAFGLNGSHKTLLFFGNIAPYKGLEYLIAALAEVAKKDKDYRLIVAGAVKGCAEYWQEMCQAIDHAGIRAQLIQRTEYVPDEVVEVFFKAADVLILPYTHIFQSGVLFLGYNFGLPVIASDVGSLREEIIEGKTGCVCRPRDSHALAGAIETYFGSNLYKELETRRDDIRAYANERYSWSKVGKITRKVYSQLIAAGSVR